MSETAIRRAAGLARVQALPKQPPHSIEAEQSVLGGLLLDNRLFFELADKLFEEDFYRADHRLIFRAITELVQANKPCDFVTLSEHLRHQGRLEEAGGVAYLGSLAVDTYSVTNVSAYSAIIHERALLRGLIAAGGDITDMGFSPEGRPPAELVDEAEKKVFAIRERGAKGQSSYEAVGTVMQRLEQRIETLRRDPKALAGLPTGFTELDRRTQGMHPGDLPAWARPRWR
jgi:replicative DNA helicase